MSSHDFFAQSFINWGSTVNIRGLWLGPPLWPNMCGRGNRVAQIPMIHHIHHHLPNQHDIHNKNGQLREPIPRTILVDLVSFDPYWWIPPFLNFTFLLPHFFITSHILLLKSLNLVDFSILIFVRSPRIAGQISHVRVPGVLGTALCRRFFVGKLLRRDHRGLLRPCGTCREVVALVWISCWCQLEEDTVGLATPADWSFLTTNS